MNAAAESKLDALLGKYSARADTGDVRFVLESPTREWRYEWSSPGPRQQYFIASTTKLYVTALVMQLRAEGAIDLDAPAAGYLPAGVMDGIHVLRGIDSSERITVRELLSHTSGIADYFEQKRRDGGTTIGRALERDFAWSFDDVLRITKEEMTPRFAPSVPGKAWYSDTNYQLLGRIIEAATGSSFEDALHGRVLGPLGLADTYPFTSETIARYDEVATMLYGTAPMRIPQAMSSVRADGGIVSTAADGIAFLRAFTSGELFPAEYLAEMQRTWNPIFPPLEYGTGLMRFALPRYYTLFREVPPMVGHSGASGTVLYHVPAFDLFISGTVNQVKKRSLSYNLMTRIVMTIQDVM